MTLTSPPVFKWLLPQCSSLLCGVLITVKHMTRHSVRPTRGINTTADKLLTGAS